MPPLPPSRYWHELRSADFGRLDPERTVVLLPVGAVEQHGPHLPVAVDACLNEALVARALQVLPEDLPLLLLPMTWVGRSVEHIDFPGTLTVTGETLERLWLDIGRSVARAGLRKLVIFNSHGGQIQTMQIVARELRIQANLFVVDLIWPQLGLPPGLVDADEQRFGIHAGEIETAMMLSLHPDLVRMTEAGVFVPLTQRSRTEFPLLASLGAAGFGWKAQDLHPSGAAGAAAQATAATGRAIIDHVGRQLAALLIEVSRFPLSEFASVEGAARSP